MHSFQEGFKRARKAAGYTQKSFAEEYGCGLETVRTWEQGRHTPSLSEMEKLCKFFECSFGYLMAETSIKTPDEEMRIACEYTGLSESSVEVLRELKESRFVIDQMLLQTYEAYADISSSNSFRTDTFAYCVVQQIYSYLSCNFYLDARRLFEAYDRTRGYYDAVHGWPSPFRVDYFDIDTIERLFLNRIGDSLKELNRKLHKEDTSTKGND